MTLAPSAISAVSAGAAPLWTPSPERVARANLPRTINGKLSELAVRTVIHGRPVGNAGALANPQVLELFRGRPELAT